MSATRGTENVSYVMGAHYAHGHVRPRKKNIKVSYSAQEHAHLVLSRPDSSLATYTLIQRVSILVIGCANVLYPQGRLAMPDHQAQLLVQLAWFT